MRSWEYEQLVEDAYVRRRPINAVYAITCLPTGCVYVGCTCNPRHRLLGHFYSLRKGNHKIKRLQDAYNRYGDSEFEFEFLWVGDEWGGPEYERERYWINRLNATDPAFGFNTRKNQA